MPLFRCDVCDCVDNTAISGFWPRQFRGKTEKLCSECNPDIGKWHNNFEKKSAKGMYIDDKGFLWSEEEVKNNSVPEVYKIISKIE